VTKPDGPRIVIQENGPYVVTGGVPVVRETIVSAPDGESIGWATREVVERHECALCRCGASNMKPYCDGTHVVIGFDGSETASREPYAERADLLEGPGLDITDVKELCSEARHCHPYTGVWHEIDESDNTFVRDRVIAQCQLCPSGRYVAVEKESGAPLEPMLPMSVGLIKDPVESCDGPLWVRGGIPVEGADGHEYEVRNRQTLCRCGKSKNKPFCDGSHIAAGFREQEHS
jgi:CDGSH-type Zn-finger protein